MNIIKALWNIAVFVAFWHFFFVLLGLSLGGRPPLDVTTTVTSTLVLFIEIFRSMWVSANTKSPHSEE